MSEEQTVRIMVFISAAAGVSRLLASLLIYYFDSVRTGIIINALVGPLQLFLNLSIVALGLMALAGEISLLKIVLILVGTILIVIGSL